MNRKTAIIAYSCWHIHSERERFTNHQQQYQHQQQRNIQEDIELYSLGDSLVVETIIAHMLLLDATDYAELFHGGLPLKSTQTQSYKSRIIHHSNVCYYDNSR